MINYIEKGIELHEEIARQGYSLVNLNGEWVADDEIAVQQIIDSFVPPSPPNWDNFNLAMITDPDFNQVYNTANALAPVITASLPASLTQVANGQVSMFNLIFNQICQLGNATNEMRETWANYGTQNNLPLEFIDILRGNDA